MKMTSANLEFEPSTEELGLLREWLRQVPHIVQDYDDETLAAFVRGCKGSLQKVKRLLENFNALGFKYPDYFRHLDIFDEKIQETMNIVKVYPLPKRTKDGSHIFICAINRDGKGDPYKIHVFEILRYAIMSLFIFFWEDRLGAGKLIIVFDFKNLGPAHMREITPMAIKQLYDIQENSLPVRLQAIHHVNTPPFLEWLLNFVKAFAKKKIADRTHFYTGVEPLYNSVNRELLPKDYGGDEEDSETLHDRWKKKIEGYRDRLMEENLKMRNLDSARPKENDSDELAGTFRTLNVD